MPTTATPSPARRNPALVTLDIVAGIVFIVFGIVVALGVLTTAISFGALHDTCGAGPYDGLTCNSTVLGIVVYGLMAVAVLALFLGFGLFLVNVIRKRVAFYWPLAGIVLTLVLFYIGTWVAGMTVPDLS